MGKFSFLLELRQEKKEYLITVVSISQQASVFFTFPECVFPEKYVKVDLNVDDFYEYSSELSEVLLHVSMKHVWLEVVDMDCVSIDIFLYESTQMVMMCEEDDLCLL